MAHLWRRSSGGEWEPITLNGQAYVLDAFAPASGEYHRELVAQTPFEIPDLHQDSSQGPTDELAPIGRATSVLRRAAARTDDTWVLFARQGARILVNGLRVDLGILVLSDRDEIRLASGQTVYFSTESLAAVVPYPGDARGFCPRCKNEIEAEEPAVRCPGCGLWHHAGERPCWTYSEQCAACAQHTAPDAGYRWTPEEL